MDEITRREKLYAKICWPEIDTQRTKFYLVNVSAPTVTLPVYRENLKHYTNDEPVPSALGLSLEHVRIDKWAYRGKRRNLVARWGYSRKLDMVLIRDVRVEYDTPQVIVPAILSMFGDDE
jgi:hypothetical protein